MCKMKDVRRVQYDREKKAKKKALILTHPENISNRSLLPAGSTTKKTICGNVTIAIGIMKDFNISSESLLADLNNQLFQESVLCK